MMNTQMNPGGLTDDELLRLARLLQQTRGEGLAFINQGEAQMLREAGGSGQPIPGTQGFGVGGGPIRSYVELTDVTTEQAKEAGLDSNNNNNNNNNGGNDGDGGLGAFVSGPIGPEPGGSESTPSETSEQQKASEKASIEGQAKAHNENTIRFEKDPRVIQEYNRQKLSQGGGDSGGVQVPTTFTPPPKFKDQFGNEYDTEEEADAANEKITKQQIALRSFIDNQITSDQNFENFSIKFFKEREKVTPGASRQVKGEPRLETLEEWKKRTNARELPQLVQSGTRLETQEEWSRRTGIASYNAYLHSLNNKPNPPGVVPPPPVLQKPNYVKQTIEQQYNAAKANNELQMVDTFTTETDPDTTEIVRQAEGFDLLPEAEVERIFNEQRVLALENAGPQTKKFTDTITRVLQNKTGTGKDGVVTSIPRTQEELENLTFDDVASELTGYLSQGEIDLLSENTKRTIFQTMLNNAVRTERFTLTPEEVAAFARDAIQVDTTGVTDATSPQITAPSDAVAPTVGTIDTVTAPTIDTVDEAVAPTITAPGEAVAPTITDYDEASMSAAEVDPLTAPDRTIIDDVGNINQEFLKQVRDGENELAEILKNRISGEAKSPAEQQLRQATENNLRTLLSTTAGVIDPAKLRQVRNLYSETAQELSGQAAELRSREQIDAENRLVSLYEQQGTRELQIAMADLENDRQIAIEQGRLDQARKLTILEADLQRIITKATLKQGIEIANLRERAATARAQGEIDLAVELENQATARAIAIAQGQIDADTEIANLRERAANARAQGQIDLAVALENSANRRAEVIAQQESDTAVAIANLNAAKDVAIAQGRIDVAIAIANLEKDVTLATTNADLALRSRALDDALALANFEGEMALEGIETKVELAEFDAQVKEKLVELGIESQEKLAELNRELQISLASLNKQYQQSTNNTAQQAAILNAIATVVAAAI